MPRNKSKHKKFQKLEGEDGWTHVVRGPRLPSTELNRPTKDGAILKLCKIKAASILSLDQIRNKYHKSQQYWAEDPLRYRFKEIFNSKIVNVPGIVIDNAIVLGLGSLATDNVDSDSMHQFVLFECWIEFLRTKYDIQKIYFQDPCFLDNDRTFLAERGFSVIESPEAYLLLNTNTLLFSPYLPWQLTHTFLYVSYPVIFIGNNIYANEGLDMMLGRRIVLRQPIVKDFYVSCNWRSLGRPGVTDYLDTPKHAQWLHDIVVYWRCGTSNQEIQDDNKIEFDDSNAILRELFEQHIPGSQRTFGPMDKSSLRVGSGEWRDEGYVFDDELKNKIQKIQNQKAKCS